MFCEFNATDDIVAVNHIPANKIGIIKKTVGAY